MSQNKLILKLTAEQQKQIKDATGENVSQLTIGFRAAGSDISERDLDKVVGGAASGAVSGQAQKGGVFEISDYSFDIEQTLGIGSQSSGAGAGKVTFNP